MKKLEKPSINLKPVFDYLIFFSFVVIKNKKILSRNVYQLFILGLYRRNLIFKIFLIRNFMFGESFCIFFIVNVD